MELLIIGKSVVDKSPAYPVVSLASVEPAIPDVSSRGNVEITFLITAKG